MAATIFGEEKWKFNLLYCTAYYYRHTPSIKDFEKQNNCNEQEAKTNKDENNEGTNNSSDSSSNKNTLVMDVISVHN